MELPKVGQRVRIKWSKWTSPSIWDGIFPVVEVCEDNGMVTIKHPSNGLGGFFPDDYEILPLTKLEKALK